MTSVQAVVRQRTFGNYGHFLNHRQALSTCGRILYYDTRNADTQIAQTTRIEALDLTDDSVRVMYDTHSQSMHGPGVGAVVCHPLHSGILFIHGLLNCDQKHPYSMHRRFGAWLPLESGIPSGGIRSLESRSLQTSLDWGDLGGGSHAHSFSTDGRWVSFTYNDAHKPERRSVGIAYVDRWDDQSQLSQAPNSEQYDEEFRGVGWAALAVVPEDPILSAREECWVERRIGGETTLSLAMLVQIQSDRSQQLPVDEIFLAEFPSHPERWQAELKGKMLQDRPDNSWRIQPPPDIRLRRLTYTQTDKSPGIQGPRHWLIASECGNWIVAMRRDSRGIVRLVRVSVDDGRVEWISGNRESITHPPAIDQKNGRLSYLISKRLVILDLHTGVETEVEWDSESFAEVIGPVQFMKGSQGIFWNARPRDSQWLQIWTASWT